MDSLFDLKPVPRNLPLDPWEALWAPYDAQTYDDALAALGTNDVVLDIGAGDLRFACRAAKRVRRVIAIEQHKELLPDTLPKNVCVVCGDARMVEFPQGITVAVLLMRHCQHFKIYREKLERVGCERLITNARWGMSVEVIDLRTSRKKYVQAPNGWYACKCGAVGFKVGPDANPEWITELNDCPRCRG